MANIFDVAHYVLEKTGSLSTWKLQKLCYYSQAWSLAWTEETLFNEDFQAWTNGPVSPVLYDLHRGEYMVDASCIPPCYLSKEGLNADQKDTIDLVIGRYGEMKPYELREQTHSEEPWIAARGDTPEFERSTTTISKKSMGDYYGSL